MKRRVNTAIQEGNNFEAVVLLSQVLELNKFDYDAYLQRSETYFKLKRHSLALGDVDKCIAINPNDTNVSLNNTMKLIPLFRS